MIPASHVVTMASVATMSGQLKLYSRSGHRVSVAVEMPRDVCCPEGAMHRSQNVYVLHVSSHNDRMDAPRSL
jgi:hypothetical protein